MACAAGDGEVPDDGGVLAVPNDQQFAEHWPKQFRLHWPGEDYAYDFKKVNIIGLFLYICKKGSDWGRDGEGFVLFREEGTWIAWNGDFTANGDILLCRQQVFRCHEDFTQPGTYVVQINFRATPRNERHIVEWQDGVLVTTTESQKDA